MSNYMKYILILIGLSVFPTCNAAASEYMNLKLFLLPETKACAPHGYGTLPCRKWSADDAENILSGSPIFSRFSIPPGSKIQLGEALKGAIENYFDISCSGNLPCMQNASKRNSIVLIFEWSKPQTGTISFTRLENSSIKEYSAASKLHNEIRWVNHQRAEYFLPMFKFEWVISLGSEKWRLSAE